MDVADLLIIGGGINGCGIAADAAGRGLKVVLCEAEDLASGTSAWSSKLIHGGLRYLEQGAFKLVHDALKEREILLKKAPFLIHPLEFILPHEAHLRPAWMIQTGLFLYDHLAKRKHIPRSKKIRLNSKGKRNPLQSQYQTGFSYYDCQTDDARLTLLNALAAKQAGAEIHTRMRCQTIKACDQHWLVCCQDTLQKTEHQFQAKTIVNAAGPWVESINQLAEMQPDCHVQLVQGSHIVVPKLYEGEHAYILQNSDERIVFAIPYLNHFTLIGTTDLNYQGEPRRAKITPEETNYLCDIINHYFRTTLTPNNICWSFSGVRPLYQHHGEKKPSKATREYHLGLSHSRTQLPFLSVYGGKITTFRVLAEAVLAQLKPYLPPHGTPWTAEAPLPGGDLGSDFQAFLKTLYREYSWLPKSQCRRYALAYGTNIRALLSEAGQLRDLGRHFGADLYEREVLYWIANEWAQSSEDMLWRRSKLGLFLSDAEQAALAEYLDAIMR